MNRDVRLIALALLLWGFGEGLFFYIEPLYIEQLGADPVQLGTVLSAAAVIRAAVYLPGGIMADRIPRKRLVVGGWMVGVAGVLVVGAARSWQGLIPGLLIYALSAYCVPVINAYLAHSVGGRRLARTFTTVFAGYAIGGVLSPPVGGWIAEATSMRMVYFVSALVFALSMLTVLHVSPQPAKPRSHRRRQWESLLNRRFLSFAAVVWLMFAAMFLSYPLASNFLKHGGGWSIAQIGALGSFQALGAAFLGPLLGRLSDGAARQDPFRDEGAPRVRTTTQSSLLHPSRALLVGQGLVWFSALVLLLAATFPVLAVAYLLRGAYQGCRSLTQAQATTLADQEDRGLVLGATETAIAAAQVLAPYTAGWLYAGDSSYPIVASLVLIPVTLLVSSVWLNRGDV